MANPSVNVGEIPPIGGSQIGINPQKVISENSKPDVAMFDNAPNDVSFGSFFGRIFLGTIVGICVAALLFGSFAIGGMFNVEEGIANPISWILFPIMGFIACFVGNLALAGLYNIFFSKRYYNFSKMFGLIFISSILILPLFIILYAIYRFVNNANIDILYFILKFQIIFSLFVSLNLIDFLSQPNYSASSLMGNCLGCALAVVVALLINGGNLLAIIVPAITTYACTVFGATVWDAIYYKFYEWGSNPFYLPSLTELREERQREESKKEKEDVEINVEMK